MSDSECLGGSCNRADIRKLALNNPIVNAGIGQYDHGQYNWLEAMMVIVSRLAAQNDDLTARLIRARQREDPSFGLVEYLEGQKSEEES